MRTGQKVDGEVRGQGRRRVAQQLGGRLRVDAKHRWRRQIEAPRTHQDEEVIEEAGHAHRVQGDIRVVDGGELVLLHARTPVRHLLRNLVPESVGLRLRRVRVLHQQEAVADAGRPQCRIQPGELRHRLELYAHCRPEGRGVKRELRVTRARGLQRHRRQSSAPREQNRTGHQVALHLFFRPTAELCWCVRICRALLHSEGFRRRNVRSKQHCRHAAAVAAHRSSEAAAHGAGRRL